MIPAPASSSLPRERMGLHDLIPDRVDGAVRPLRSVVLLHGLPALAERLLRPQRLHGLVLAAEQKAAGLHAVDPSHAPRSLVEREDTEATLGLGLVAVPSELEDRPGRWRGTRRFDRR